MELASLANHRLTDARGVFREVKPKPSLHAKEILVDSAQVPVVRTQNLVVAYAQCDLAAIRAVRAYRRDVRHFPGPRFIPVCPARQRPHRAYINAHPALFALQMILAVRDD